LFENKRNDDGARHDNKTDVYRNVQTTVDKTFCISILENEMNMPFSAYPNFAEKKSNAVWKRPGTTYVSC